MLLQHQLAVGAVAVVACCVAVELLLYYNQVTRQVCPAGAGAGAGSGDSLLSAVLAACMLDSSHALLLLLHVAGMRQRRPGMALLVSLLLGVLACASSCLMLLLLLRHDFLVCVCCYNTRPMAAELQGSARLLLCCAGVQAQPLGCWLICVQLLVHNL